jgi:4-hydroxy-tetrahydrodipicolinate reductase
VSTPHTTFAMALLGTGRLATAIAGAAKKAGVDLIQIAGTALRRPEPPAELVAANARGAKLVLVDASSGEAAPAHLGWALELNVPLVLGTTGHGLAREAVAEGVGQRIGVLLAPNFAPGALLLGRVAEALGGWCKAGDFSPFLEERHHALKKDAPSGTALWLDGRLKSTGGPAMPITSTRAGQLPGAHTLGLHAAGELLEFSHTALARDAYGTGAVAACRFLVGRKGVFGIEDWAAELFPWPSH